MHPTDHPPSPQPKKPPNSPTHPSTDFHAAPLESDLFEWHFTLRGPPPPSPYAGGLYHGRILLPSTYPLRPPSFRFATPSGRFEVNREICLSISGHHEESWQPAWGVRTALVALRSFMDSDAKGQLGGLDGTAETRRRLAGESVAWTCRGCDGKANGLRMEELGRAVEEMGSAQETEKVPEELRLAFKDEMKGGADVVREEGRERQAEGDPADGSAVLAAASSATSVEGSRPAEESGRPEELAGARIAINRADMPALERGQQVAATLMPARSEAPVQEVRIQQVPQRRREERLPNQQWVDLAIVGVALTLAFMIIRKLVSNFYA